MKKILLTGGGTAGHVTPNIALIPGLKEMGFEIRYIGSYDGIEKKLIEDCDISYIGISSGKLRRYFSTKNFSDPFRVLKGFSEARKIIKDYRPDVVFSKGGFVSVPVVLAAKHYNIPVIIHESDMTPGLANKIAIPKAKIVCHNFPETKKYLPNDKAVWTGSPIREELLSGNKHVGYEICDFSNDLPTILIIGGSLGASAINNAVRNALPSLTENFQICHICGKGKLDPELIDFKNYKQFEYVSTKLKDFFAMSDLIISRAGANSIFEFLALKKPSILIPLPATKSRGDQILNADSFKKQGFCEVIDEADLSLELLVEKINFVYKNKSIYIENMEKSSLSKDAVSKVLSIIEETVK